MTNRRYHHRFHRHRRSTTGSDKSSNNSVLPLLHISVSDIAAMTGYHPYCDLPELMLKYVYQNRYEKMESDAQLLGITLYESNEQYWINVVKESQSTNKERLLQEVVQNLVDIKNHPEQKNTHKY